MLNLQGKSFGRWKVHAYAGKKGSATLWKCVCSCGTEKILRIDSLRTRNSQSCGCLRKDKNKKRMTTHGLSSTYEYYAWLGLRKRCSKKYFERKYYADRGIKVCERWQNSFENFLEDMGIAPSPVHSVERKNNEKGYSPENCKWVTPLIQSRNKRVYISNASGISGVTWDKRIKKWAVNISVSGKRIWLGASNNLLDAAALRKSAELKYWS